MARKRKAGSQSAGYHADLSIPGYNPKTPTVAPAPSEAAKGPAGDYSGAGREYETAVEALPAEAQAVTEAATRKAAAEEHAARVAKRAETRQKRLVSKYVTHAYSRKLKKQGVPALEVDARVAKAKDQLQKDRETLLSHPAIQDANASGKVVGPKGLRRVKRDVAQAKSQVIKAGTERVGDPLHSITGTVKGAYEAMARDQPGASVARDAVKSEATNLGEAVKESIEDTVSGRDFLKPAPSAKQIQAASLIPAFGVTGKAAKVVESAGPSLLPKILGAAEKVRGVPGMVKATPGVVKAVPGAVRAGAKAAPGVGKSLAKAAPAAAGRGAARGSAATFHSVGGLAALGAVNRGGLNIPGGAILEGQALAAEEDLPQVLSSTANLAPGLLTGAFQLPVAAGASAVTGSAKPLEGALNEQVNFFKHFAETYGSNDPEKIKQATLKEGLLPEILLAPLAAKAGGKLGSPVRSRVAGKFEAHRAPAMDAEGNILLHEHGGAAKRGHQRVPEPTKVTRLGEHNAHRREEAFHAATTNDTIQLEHARRREYIDKHARKAAGKKTVVREGLGPKGKDTLHQRPPDYIPFLNRAGIDLRNPEAALREIQHYAEKFKDLDHPTKYGVNPEALTARDAVKFFTDHPEALKDQHLAAALDEFRSMQNGEKGLRSLSTSDRNRYLAHAVMHDIPDAKDRVPMGAREHTEATTREGAWEDLNKRTKQVNGLRKEGRKKYDQAQEASPDRAAKLRNEAKSIYEKARSIDKGRRELHDALKDFTRPGAKANPNAKRIAYDEALEQEMVDEARTSLEAKGLHPEPAYMPDTDAISRATPYQTASGGPKPLPGGAKINEGYNWRHGLTRQGYEHMMDEGILRQVARNHQFENARRFRADRGIQFEGDFQHTGKVWARAFDHGVMNRRDVALVPTQVVNRLEKATQGGDPTEYEAALAEMQAARKVDPKDAQSGTIYEAYPKAAYDEWVQQAQKTNIPKALRTANRWTSKNMLSTPAFVAAQVVAETAQAIAEVNPLRMIQGLRHYNKLTPEQKLRISGASGETAKAIFSPEDLQTTLGSYNEKPFTDALSFFRRNVFGRSAKSFVTLRAAGEIDRLKGSYIRRGTLTGQIMRDLNGTWAKGRKLLKTQTEIQKQIGRLKPHEQLAWIAEHPKVLDRYQRDLHAAMGGWGNLTRTGKVPENVRAATLVFYPYLRMSIQWPLKYAMRHPIKATALGYLAAENNFALREALGGDPSFLNYAQIPVYGVGEDGKPTTINLSRIAPGGNALVTAVQGSGSLLGALQPVLAAGIEGATGKGPLGEAEGGFPAHLKAAGAGILGLSPYVRAADTLKGQKDSGQSEYGILGKRANIALNPLAALSSKLKGGKGEQLTRSLAFPFLPQNIDHQRDYAKLGRILTKLGDTGSSAQAKQQATKGTASEQRAVRSKVEAMQKENAKAEKGLEALYAKYGLSKVAARSLGVYKYTHPYPDEDGSKGPYEGSGYGGSGYEGTGYGGGDSTEKPIPVPQQADGVGFNLPGLGGAVGAITNPLASLVLGEQASAAELPKGLQRKTAGSPSTRELVHAGRAGTLKLNRQGRITTPAVRKAAKEVQKAAARVGPPRVEGMPDDPSSEFASYLAKYSGLDPRFAAAWTLSEMGAEVSGGGAGKFNFLGVRYPGEMTPFAATQFNGGAKQAAKKTVEWMEGKAGAGTPDEAASTIQAIIPTAAGKGPQAALEALAASGWGTNVDHVAQNLSGVSVASDPGGDKGARQALKVAKRNARRLGLNPTPFNGDVEAGMGKTVTVRADAKGMVNWAKSALGTDEGTAKQLRWAAKEGLPGSEPWCANFISNGLERRGVAPPPNPNYVPSYENEWSGGKSVGTDLSKAKPGDLIAYSGQHIALYVGNGKVIGGNQSDSVTETDAAAGPAPISAILRPGYRGGRIQIHESTVLPGATPGAIFGGITPSGEVESAVSTTQKPKKGQRKPTEAGLTGTQRLKLVNEISSGNLEGLGIPGYTPKIGPSAADLAAIGETLRVDRRRLRGVG